MARMEKAEHRGGCAGNSYDCASVAEECCSSHMTGPWQGSGHDIGRAAAHVEITLSSWRSQAVCRWVAMPIYRLWSRAAQANRPRRSGDQSKEQTGCVDSSACATGSTVPATPHGCLSAASTTLHRRRTRTCLGQAHTVTLTPTCDVRCTADHAKSCATGMLQSQHADCANLQTGNDTA